MGPFFYCAKKRVPDYIGSIIVSLHRWFVTCYTSRFIAQTHHLTNLGNLVLPAYRDGDEMLRMVRMVTEQAVPFPGAKSSCHQFQLSTRNPL